jgi:hypothetical protein
MAEESAQTRRRRLPGVSDLLDVTDEMIAFADKYQEVWEHEAKATLALGEFLHARSQSLRAQVELMRMGTEAFRKYSAWSEALFGVRPETFMQGFMDQMERWRPGARREPSE